MGNNTVDWWEFPVDDLAAAQRFYSTVFGWKFTPFGDDYLMAAAADGTPIGGFVAGGLPSIRLYAGVEDLEATLAGAVAAGGKVRKGRQLISEEFGWWALLQDANGHEFGLSTNNAAKS